MMRAGEMGQGDEEMGRGDGARRWGEVMGRGGDEEMGREEMGR